MKAPVKNIKGLESALKLGQGRARTALLTADQVFSISQAAEDRLDEMGRRKRPDVGSLSK